MDIDAIFISPTYSQSNGQVKKGVGIFKKILKKVRESGGDMWQALLHYRNAPITGMPYSPAEMLLSRQLRTTLPTTADQLEPEIATGVSVRLENWKTTQKNYYDRMVREAESFKIGDKVWYYNNHNPELTAVIDQAPRP